MSFTLPLTEPAGIFSVVLVIILVAPFLAERLRLPGIVGLALAGVLVGPHVLNLIAKDSAIEFLGTIGLMYVFFVVGVEIDIAQLRRESRSGLAFYAFTFGLPFLVGVGTGLSLFGVGILSAMLLGCVFSSYTLVPYPIVSRLGLTRQRSVVAAVSAVILTDTTALAIMAAVARASHGGGDWLIWAKMLGAVLVWALLSAILIPKAAELFFRKVKPDGTVEFVFVIALVFICAFTSRLAGLEPIIGAFVAGILLNRFIPESGVLMNRVKFSGDALFVPFFMVYIGVLADPAAIFGSLGALGVALAMVALNIASKWLAASGTGFLLGYRKDERRMLFGLSVNHAAAVLAVALVGFRLGLFSQAVLDGTVFLIIASCFVGALATQRAGKRLAAACEDRQPHADRSPERILVAISNPASIRDLLALAFLLRTKRSEEPVYPLAVVPESANTRLEIAKAENSLAQAVVQGVSASVPVIPATRVSVNVSEGIIQAALENRAGAIVLGWNKAPRLSQAFFGSAIEQVIRGASELVVVARITKPLNNVGQVVLVLPPLVERHPGFRRGLAYLANLVSQTGAKLAVYCQKPDGAAVIDAMGSTRSSLRAQVVELDSWKSFAQVLDPQGSVGQAFVLFSPRPGEAAWHPAVEKLPHRVGEERPDIPLLIFYLSGGVEADAAAGSAPSAPSGGDIFERALAAGRVRPKMEETSINDAIRELLRSHFDADRKALARLSAVFTDIAQKQPIELEPGVLLLHAHVEEAAEPLVFFGARPEGLRLLSLEAPARLVVLLCAPSSQTPEEHLKILGEIARLLKGGRVAERLGLERQGPREGQ
ncbi:MAG: cation:proton antiporter [Rectinemataceae bacterium]|jgi:Kef-type K+ transport system membrane component KefB/nucleotide-binding universal stress UspA family protein/mannitol/fructose-specific phosphotransferase system IIA component (Ntr-type)